MNVVNKYRLAEYVEERVGLDPSTSRAVVDALIGAIQENLYAGNTVDLLGFGKWRVMRQPDRPGYSYRLRRHVHVPAYDKIVWKTSDTFQEKIKKRIERY